MTREKVEQVALMAAAEAMHPMLRSMIDRGTATTLGSALFAAGYMFAALNPPSDKLRDELLKELSQ